jgi:hypothetical protein
MWLNENTAYPENIIYREVSSLYFISYKCIVQGYNMINRTVPTGTDVTWKTSSMSFYNTNSSQTRRTGILCYLDSPVWWRLWWQKRHSTLFTSKLGTNLRKKQVKCYVWCTELYGAENLKYLNRFEMRVLEKVGEDSLDRSCEKLRSTTYSPGGEEYPTYNKTNWIGRILCRNCLLKHVTEGQIEGRTEVTGRRERTCK